MDTVPSHSCTGIHLSKKMFAQNPGFHCGLTDFDAAAHLRA